MSSGIQIALLAIVIIILYIVTSRWQPNEPSLLGMRASFWIGLAAAALALALVAISKLRHF